MTTIVFNGVETKSRQGHLLAIMITAVVLATMIVTLRFLAVWKRTNGYGKDDVMIGVSLLILFVLLGVGLAMIHIGLGVHSGIMTNDQTQLLLQALLAFECIYVVDIATIKLSVLLMYSKIFPTRFMYISAWILGGIAVSWAIAIAVVCIIQCIPIEKAWIPSIPGHCINLKDSFIGNAVPNIVTDVLILALPIKHVCKLRTTISQKVLLVVIFLLGSFVVFTSVYRFSTLFQFDPKDTSWTIGTACAWCIMEASSGVISACLPTLGPILHLLKPFVSCLRSSSSSSPKMSTELVTIGGHNGKGERIKHKLAIADDEIPLTSQRSFHNICHNSFVDLVPQTSNLEKPKYIRSNAFAENSGRRKFIPWGQIQVDTTISWEEERLSEDHSLV